MKWNHNLKCNFIYNLNRDVKISGIKYSSTPVHGRHLNILKKSMTRDYDYHYSVDYLLKDKINTKLRMNRLYRFDDQIDTIFFSEIF